jgi:hypothetical protein
MGKGGNQPGDWGAPGGWSVPSGRGGRNKPPRITYHGGAKGPGSGCVVIALVLLGLPAGLIVAAVHGMGWL